MLILDLKPCPKTRTNEPSDVFLYLRETSLDTRLEVKHFSFFCLSGCWFSGLWFSNFSSTDNTEKEI